MKTKRKLLICTIITLMCCLLFFSQEAKAGSLTGDTVQAHVEVITVTPHNLLGGEDLTTESALSATVGDGSEFTSTYGNASFDVGF